MINRLGYLFLLPITALGCQAQNDVKQKFAQMEWLIGTWKGEAGGQPFYENWRKLSDTEFENINFSLCNGDSTIDGHSKIEIKDNTIAYTSAKRMLELKSVSNTQMIFENSQTGETFTFAKTDKGEWVALLKYPRNQVEYVLQKTNSLAELLKNKPPVIEGNFAGHFEFNGKKLETSINFINSNGKQTATGSTPENHQVDQPFSSVCYDPPFLKLVTQDGGRTVTLNAKLENDVITGQIAGVPAHIYLKRQVK